MSPLYLYAVVDEEPASPGAGIAGEPLRLVRCGGLLVVAGERDSMTVTHEILAAQDAVVRRLAGQVAALLPVRFGERARDESDLCDLLKPRTSALLETLEQVRGCEQMTLRVFGDPAPVEEEPEQGGPGTRYLAARRREIERSRSLPEIQPLLDRLRPWVRGERIERKPSGSLLGSVYHLVRKEDVPNYLAAVREFQLAGVAVSGPWPPYAFAPGLGDPS